MTYIEKMNEYALELENKTVNGKSEIKAVIETLKKGDNVKVNYSYGKDVKGKVEKVMCGLYEIVYHNNYRSTYHYEKVEEINEYADTRKLRFICSVFIKLEGQYNPLILDIDEINSVKKDFTKVQYKAIDKAYDYCNLNSQDDDCIWKSIYKYKALRELTDDQQEEVYDLISKRLGF